MFLFTHKSQLLRLTKFLYDGVTISNDKVSKFDLARLFYISNNHYRNFPFFCLII